MTANIHEPTHARSIAQTRAVGKDTRQRPYAGRWIKPLDIAETPDATDPDYTPTLQNDFVQSNTPFTPWAFRLAYSGDLQFQGVLDVSAATNGTVAITLPGYAAEEPYFAPAHDQGYTTKVTVDGTTVLNAVAAVDVSTGDVTVSWLNAGVGIHEIKVFEDITAVVVGDNAFIWEIPEDLDGATIIKVGGFISTPGSSPTQVAIRLTDCDGTGGDILDDKITIETGECSSKTAATPPAVADNTVVAWGDLLHIDVDLAGGGALGLGVHVIYATPTIGSIGIEGTPGPPGGVTQFQGSYPGGPGAAGTPGGAGSAWTTATNYVIGDVVQNGGTYYVATANHTSGALTEPGVGANWMTVWTPLVYQAGDIVTNNGTVYVTTVTHTATTATEPGVGVDWETVFAPLFETAVYSGVDIAMSGGGFALSIGRKAMAIVPFDAEIVEATLLADQAGNAVVDIWKDTYGNHPPTDADSITGGTPPTLVGASKTTDTTLSGWTTTLTAGDILIINIDSVSQVNLLTLALRLLRTP